MQTSSNSADSKLFKRDPRQLQGPQEGLKKKPFKYTGTTGMFKHLLLRSTLLQFLEITMQTSSNVSFKLVMP